MANPWSLYMIECRGGGIYTGIAIDVDERFKTHVAGKGAKYTKMNPPLRIIARQRFPDRRSAAQAEYAMKRLTPLEKRQWAFTMNGGIVMGAMRSVEESLESICPKSEAGAPALPVGSGA